MMRNYADEVRETSELLSSARVAVYPVDARGLMSLPSFQASGMGPGRTGLGASSNGAVNTDPHIPVSNNTRFAQQTQAEQASMKQIAEQTGGQAYIDTNGLKEAVEGAVENGSSYYTVGYAPGGKLDGQFRKITLRLDDAAAYKLAYRRGYYADPSEKPSAHNAGEPTLMTAATLLGAPPTARRRSSGNTTPATGSPASQTLTPVTSVGSNISRIASNGRTYELARGSPPREGAEAAAGTWATGNGGVTLGMTAEGQSVDAATQGLDWFSQARPMWVNASESFANSASGDVVVFQGPSVGLNSVWATTEYPALMANPSVTSITYMGVGW
jgi:hypothetical protein